MDEEVLWTIAFGLIGTIIGLVTIWQNSVVVQARLECKSSHASLSVLH
jgi:hypothetical protein